MHNKKHSNPLTATQTAKHNLCPNDFIILSPVAKLLEALIFLNDLQCPNLNKKQAQVNYDKGEKENYIIEGPTNHRRASRGIYKRFLQ